MATTSSPSPSPSPSLGSLRFSLSLESGNTKTGRMPVSTSSRATCWTGCPFYRNGCYGDQFPLNLHWNAVTAGTRGMPWAQFVAAVDSLPAGTLWRHNQAGDLYRPSTAIGRKALDQLVEANRGKRGYTYSHHKRTASVVQTFRAATANGFTINASCQSESEADGAIASGLRAVFVVPSTETRTAWTTPDGNRAVVCPAQRVEGVTCATCKLCQSRPETIAIAFKAHGNGKRKVEAAIAAVTGGKL